MNRRQAVQVIVGTAVGLLTAPSEASAPNTVQTPLKLPPEEMVPEGLHAKVYFTVEPEDLLNAPEGRKVTGVLGSWWEEKSPNVRVPASIFIEKAHEAVAAIFEAIEIDPTRNVEIRFTFADPYQDYNEVWEATPEDFRKYRGFMVNRALTCEVSRISREAKPFPLQHEPWEVRLADAQGRPEHRREIRQALRYVEIIAWAAPEL